jgi:hypothetical protein
LKELRRPPEPIERTALIEGDYRWSLTRRWAPGPLLPWCGCNPSRADAEIDDPTIWREMTFAWRWGYGGIIKSLAVPHAINDRAAALVVARS